MCVFLFDTLHFDTNTIFLFEDGHESVVDENDGPEPMEHVAGQNDSIVEIIATHNKYLRDEASSESSTICPMAIEKSKDYGIRMKEVDTKRDYIRYIVQNKVMFFDLKLKKCMSGFRLLNYCLLLNLIIG